MLWFDFWVTLQPDSSMVSLLWMWSIVCLCLSTTVFYGFSQCGSWSSCACWSFWLAFWSCVMLILSILVLLCCWCHDVDLVNVTLECAYLVDVGVLLSMLMSHLLVRVGQSFSGIGWSCWCRSDVGLSLRVVQQPDSPTVQQSDITSPRRSRHPPCT